MVMIGDISNTRGNVNRKATRPPKRRTQKKKNAKTVRKRKTGRRVGNVFVYVSDLHNIFFVYFYTILY